MSFNYSGSGQALVVREKCNANKPFTSSSEITNNPLDIWTKIFKYKNSVIGKRLFSAVLTNPLALIASDAQFVFKIVPFNNDLGSFVIIWITGVFKKCNYSSREIQKLNIPVTAANKEDKSVFGSIAQGGDELKKILDADPVLRESYEKLIAK